MLKSIRTIFAVSTIAVGAFAQTAAAASWGLLTLSNNSPYFMSYTVMSDGWNCNDAPLRGVAVDASPNSEVELKILRKDGHGCNGEQGIFMLQMSMPTYKAVPLPISYTSDGCLVDPNDRANQLGYQLNYIVEVVGSCPSYQLIITPAVQ